ncbi:putative Kinesin family protein [Taphrina deformans PYCC 5710]|uniref:Kinesin-like protein n=1 Tax=Taphrina deformans (strain PYCC 5710 / ATCC 11124 / CBS 356.35 / IMI 108563 / JCM 9778 / NBRC 8474) TaxID=1097556 RepID=R4X707_TAPDE|nr:putative Kinesin family protein [Taphrina deformans PYCC 5710]|eukprot:CCG80808.1 putative Kinesin family protein [Taphrina deformans PYCC 5710]
MEGLQGSRKHIPQGYNGMGSSGRSSPFPGIKGMASRPVSPNITRSLQSGTGRRPPSALRNYETSQRKFINASGHGISPAEIRPGSSISSRSTVSAATGSVGAANTVVSVRIKPIVSELNHRAWICDEGNTIRSTSGPPGSATRFSFDHVFKEDDSNGDVYNQSVKRLVNAVADGFHGTVFAYGMTGTGKTYSMQGTQSEPGVIPLAVRDLLRTTSRMCDKRYTLKVSYLEIYNERIRDLLNDSLEDTDEIKIRDDPKRGIHAYPLVEVVIQSEEDFLHIMNQGEALRHSAATDFNTHSSRSHAIIQILVESTRPDEASSGSSRTSTLNLIDLAGSERAASDVERRKEGSYINKSLLTLGSVIARLTTPLQPGSTSHVPFRDSRLTRLLQHALSGLSLVSIIATINTDSHFVLETTNTLKFASRAKFIPGKAQRAEHSHGDLGLVVEKLRHEVANLRSQLLASHTVIKQLQSVASQSVVGASIRVKDSDGTVATEVTPENDARNLALHSRIEILEHEKVESDHYIQSLQARLLEMTTNTDSPVDLPGTPHTPYTNQKVPVNGNFSLPLARNSNSPAPDERVKSSRLWDYSHEERSDKDNALADQVLAKTVLSKSQRSREEARNLTLQIAQLKQREDSKSNPDSGCDALRLVSLLQKENENTFISSQDIALPKHTFISPTIRAPREGFI